MEPFTIEDLEDGSTQQPGSPKPATDVISPEPPKWRFVKEAKKSAGYSSAAAGQVVKGKSSNELGAKYHAPDVSLYKPTPDKPEVNEMVDPKAPSFKQFEKEDEEVGELQPTNLYTKTAYMKELDDVGKLNIEEGTGGDEEDLPDGSFGGLPQFNSADETSNKSFREFDNKYDVGQKPDREKGVWFDGDVEDNYKSESWGVEAGSVGGVGRLKFGGTDASEEKYDGSFMKVKKEGEEFNAETATPTTAISRGASEHGASSSLKSDEENGPAVDGMSTAMKKRRRCLVILILLPLFILVLLLGILLGKERKEEDSAGTALAVVPIFAENSTEAPSMAPSALSVLPGPSCPTDSKLISLQDLSSAVNAKEPSQSIWYVKDACTGNVISSCLPCSEDTLALGNRDDNVQQGRSNGHLRNLQSAAFQNQCVPSDGTYVFVVEPAVSPNQCCGFDTTSYILNYGDKVVASSEDDNSASSTEKQVVFGEGTACPAALLSSSPTGTPSKESTPQPTKQPSPRPTPRPTKQPSSGPTNGPTCSTEQDFNLCFAVDMSGSVCNGGPFSFGNGDCLGCPLLEGCRNIFLDQDTCCNDFQSIKTFSQLMIRALDEFPAEKDFSIVQFATDASIASFPQPANAALSTVNNLSYTGGITNHAAAIASCQQSLSSSQNPGRKNFIMLITDGEPTAPENTAEAAANFMAAQAKSNGMFIIPIFISPTYDAYALSFMRGLSSDDKVFDVTDFDGLLNLQEALVNQVSCS
mmetsp:Transcript_23427/g.46633  ORF Transcript_23427/g.46633 Transcript_23427/m.46633 type:complete len:753 (-) Transcript_23427:85-2343(-)